MNKNRRFFYKVAFCGAIGIFIDYLIIAIIAGDIGYENWSLALRCLYWGLSILVYLTFGFFLFRTKKKEEEPPKTKRDGNYWVLIPNGYEIDPDFYRNRKFKVKRTDKNEE